MPRIERWDKLPVNVRNHLIDRMRDRGISIADLNQLRLWIDSLPEVSEGDWYKDFGSFKICGCGSYPKTFLLRHQAAKGEALWPKNPDSWLRRGARWGRQPLHNPREIRRLG
jgi:hypothetical protein